jgi:hypothetical protein
MEDEPEQEALFELQGPDEDGCVWACSPDGRDVWCQNLGPAAKVAELLSQWLGSIDYDEVDTADVAPRPRTVEAPEDRAKRLEARAADRDRAVITEDDAVDAMIRKSIKDHGA